MCGHDWSSDVCSSDLIELAKPALEAKIAHHSPSNYDVSLPKLC